MQVAIPIQDRATVVGVALFDHHLTGEPLTRDELHWLCLLFDQLGAAVRNGNTYCQLSATQERLMDTLGQMGRACVILGPDLEVQQANRLAQDWFPHPDKSTEDRRSCALPKTLLKKVAEGCRPGQVISTFEYQPESAAHLLYQVSITPVRKDISSPAIAVLVVVEGGKPELSRPTTAPKSGRASLIKTMAAHLAHEIGNSLAPLSTYQQLAPREFENSDFRASFIAALGESIKRLSRLVTQMHYLSHDLTDRQAVLSVTVLIKQAIAEAKANFPDKTPSIQLEDEDGFLTLSGDSAALQHALAEILLNAFQASPANPQAHLRLQHASTLDGGQQLHIVIQDAGPGFTPDLVQRLGEPFFSSRKVGMGLGLAVARKIIEIHKGKLEILPSPPGQHGVIRVSLPLSNEA
jgi:signal transduction histidine kinase